MLEHQQYLEAVRELTDWLMTAGEELQHWTDTSGDSAAIKKKLSDVRVRRRICQPKDMLLTLSDASFVPLSALYAGFDNQTIPGKRVTSF